MPEFANQQKEASIYHMRAVMPMSTGDAHGSSCSAFATAGGGNVDTIHGFPM
jgi:hypothetical protein